MKIIVAGNWKMNQGPSETRSFFERFEPAVSPDRVGILLFPPAISLAEARAALDDDTSIGLGVQQIHWEASGALTGEISAEMAAESGADYALIGHSERRQLFGETDIETALKVGAARRAGITPVLCVGETLEERTGGRLQEVVGRQLETVLNSEGVEGLEFGPPGAAPIILAYEPVWAIGTGRTATPKDAADAHGFLRERLAAAVGPSLADTVPILYGGSVKPGNTADLLEAENVDGVLVGGASLDPESFARIASAAG